MENSPRRPPPLNLSISDLLTRSLYSPLNLVSTGPKIFGQDIIKSPFNISSKSKFDMGHSINKDNSTDISGVKKKNKNSFFQGVIGVIDSLSNIVSKISNFTSVLNNNLSVTVVPHENMISSEFLMQSMTENNRDSLTSNGSFTRMFENVKNKSMYDLKNHVTQVFAAQQFKSFQYHRNISNTENILPKEQIDHSYDEDYTNFVNEQTDLELVIEESLKSMRNYTPYCNKMDCHDLQEDENKNHPNFTVMNKKVKEKSKNISQNGSTVELKETDDLVDSEIEICNCKEVPSKMRRKFNTVALCRGRKKKQLKNSGVSQLKHQQERMKHNNYLGIKELYTWKREQDDSSMDQFSIIASSDDENDKDDTMHESKLQYPALIESIKLGDTMEIRNRITEKSLENSEPIVYNVPTYDKSRSLSESSDSDDSFIVFEDDLDDKDRDNSTDNNDESEDSEDPENSIHLHEELKSGLQVRFDLKPKIHTMIAWNSAYRLARKGPWEQIRRDRDRFQRRIDSTGKILESILTEMHRACVWKDRFSMKEE